MGMEGVCDPFFLTSAFVNEDGGRNERKAREHR